MAEWPETLKVCPEHGMSGQNQYCFHCRRPLEEIEVVPLSRLSEVEAELASLRGELATMLGEREPREGVTANDQWIAAVGEVLAEREELRELAIVNGGEWAKAAECADNLQAQLEALVGDEAVEAAAKAIYLERHWPERSWEDAKWIVRQSYEGRAAVVIHAARTAAQQAASKVGEGA